MAQEEKRNLPKLFERVEDNRSKIRVLPRINVRKGDVAYLKRDRRIRVLTQYPVPAGGLSDSLIINYDFDNLPEWVLPFIKPYHYFETTEGFVVNERLVVFGSFLWKNLGSRMRLQYIVRGALNNLAPDGSSTLITAPLYVTYELVILNENVWHEVQQKKG